MRDSTKALLAMVVGFAILLPFASVYPDDLETIAHNMGIEEPEGLWRGIMSDYSVIEIENPYFSGLGSGLLGVLLVFFFAFLVGKMATRKR